MPRKLYVLTRKDLPSNVRAVQGGHALAQFLIERKHDGEWDNGTLVYLKVKDEQELTRWSRILETENIAYSKFHEEDLNNQLTALAALPRENVFSTLPLM